MDKQTNVVKVNIHGSVNVARYRKSIRSILSSTYLPNSSKNSSKQSLRSSCQFPPSWSCIASSAMVNIPLLWPERAAENFIVAYIIWKTYDVQQHLNDIIPRRVAELCNTLCHARDKMLQDIDNIWKYFFKAMHNIISRKPFYSNIEIQPSCRKQCFIGKMIISFWSDVPGCAPGGGWFNTSDTERGGAFLPIHRITFHDVGESVDDRNYPKLFLPLSIAFSWVCQMKLCSMIRHFNLCLSYPSYVPIQGG